MDGDSRDRPQRTAGGGELALVRTAYRPAGDHVVPFSHLILHGYDSVEKGAVVGLDDLLYTFKVRLCRPTFMGVDFSDSGEKFAAPRPFLDKKIVEIQPTHTANARR